LDAKIVKLSSPRSALDVARLTEHFSFTFFWEKHFNAQDWVVSLNTLVSQIRARVFIQTRSNS